MRTDIVLLEDSIKAIMKMPDADAGALIKALINESGEGLPPMADLVYPMIKGQVDRVADIREKRAAAGRVGGSRSKANDKQNVSKTEANEEQTLSPIQIQKHIERNNKERGTIARSKKVQAAMGFSTERQDVDYNKIAWEKMWEEG